jgi:hypothetical protein
LRYAVIFFCCMRYAYPPELNEPGFFEDFFDGKTEAIVTFYRSKIIRQYLDFQYYLDRHRQAYKQSILNG